MADENIFTFDTNPFSQGLKRIANGITGVQNRAADMAQGISKGMVNAAMKIGAAAMSFKLIKAAIDQIPEIGQAFGIAKEIINKNLFYPLRQAVFPMLQSFLNWVRDNRAMFVKWGYTLVNIFNTVVEKVKQMIEFGQKLAGAFKDIINKTFGMQIKNFEDFINILTFKIAVLAEFVGQVIGNFLKPNLSGDSLLTVIQGIVELFGKIVNFVKEIGFSFLEGFLPRIKEMATPLQRIVDAFSKIFDKLFGGSEQLKIWKDVFKWLGEWTADSLIYTLETIAGLIEAVADGLEWLIDIPKKIKEALEKEKLGPGKVLSVNGQSTDKWAGTMFADPNYLTPNKKVQDAIITKRGDIIETSPEDNILAFKGGLGGKVDIKVDFSGMQIIVQEATIEEAGKMADSLVNQFRDRLTKELERKGER